MNYLLTHFRLALLALPTVGVDMSVSFGQLIAGRKASGIASLVSLAWLDVCFC